MLTLSAIAWAKAHNIASESVRILPVQMNCPDSVSRNKLNAFYILRSLYKERYKSINYFYLFQEWDDDCVIVYFSHCPSVGSPPCFSLIICNTSLRKNGIKISIQVMESLANPVSLRFAGFGTMVIGPKLLLIDPRYLLQGGQ